MSGDYPAFHKIPRLHKPVAITEKVDGTNALISIERLGDSDNYEVRAGSRNRWLTPENDNFGFAAWVVEHAMELMGLGPGLHYGEWYGFGIQRNYGLPEKHFALFNVGRWAEWRPGCCDVVPLLEWADAEYLQDSIGFWTHELLEAGSRVAPDFYKPEGLVIWHEAARQYFKVPFEGGDTPKSQQGEAA